MLFMWMFQKRAYYKDLLSFTHIHSTNSKNK